MKRASRKRWNALIRGDLDGARMRCGGTGVNGRQSDQWHAPSAGLGRSIETKGIQCCRCTAERARNWPSILVDGVEDVARCRGGMGQGGGPLGDPRYRLIALSLSAWRNAPISRDNGR